jgi:hypothetical protein
MLKKLLLIAPLGLAALFASTPDPIGEHREIGSFFPADTIALVEAPGISALLAPGGTASYGALLDHAQGTGLLPEEAHSAIRGAIALAAMAIGTGPIDAARHLTARGLAVGLGSRPDGATWGLAVHGDDEALLDSLLGRGFDLIEAKYDAEGLFDTPHDHIRGADVWRVGDELVVAKRGALLLASVSEPYLKEMLGLAADEDAVGILGHEPFREFQRASDQSSTLRGWIDMEKLAGATPDKGKLAKLLELSSIPKAQFLLGPGVSEIMSGKSLGASLKLNTQGLHFTLAGTLPQSATGLAPVEGDRPATLEVEHAIASAQLYRNLDQIVGRRNELFAPELQPKFTKTLGDLALLFGGMELDEDLLPMIDPWMQIVIQDMDFDGTPRPELALPGAAMIAKIDASIEKNMIAAFQTAVGIANTQRAQNGKSPLALNLGLEGSTMISSGHMPPPPKDMPVDADYNLAPACAYVNGYFVLGTHEAIVRDLVIGISASAAKTDSLATHETLHLNGPALGQLALQNKQYLVMQAVLDEGKAFDEASNEVDILASILGALNSLDVDLEYLESGCTTLSLDVAFADGER